MGRIGLSELLIILLILVVLFGATKIPQLGRGLGEGIRNFKKGITDDGEDKSAAKKSEDEKKDDA